ncbi:conserved hypothetical protein [Gammaproteobacteria bacterium]
MQNQRSPRIAFYRNNVEDLLVVGGGYGLREQRSELGKIELTQPEQEELMSVDTIVIDYLGMATTEEIWPGLLIDDPSADIKDWWWHLGALHHRSYPADRLSEGLRETYLNP